jgi:TBC1 domain family protein 5
VSAQRLCRKWVRLLFCREFKFQDVLCLWDGIFAESSDLSAIDYVCIVMLGYVRDSGKRLTLFGCQFY